MTTHGDKIFIVGQGKVGTNISLWCVHAGVEFVAVSRRGIGGAMHFDDFLRHPAEPQDVVLLCVQDDHLAPTIAQLRAAGCQAVLLHTSGIYETDESEYPAGAFYPFQTFSGEPVSAGDITIFITTDSEKVAGKAELLARRLGLNYAFISSEKKAQYHLAAVIAANFSNALWAWAEELSKFNSLEMDKIYRITEQTLKNAEKRTARNSQTGPAKREDAGTMERHLEMLNTEAEKSLYIQLSELIHKQQK